MNTMAQANSAAYRRTRSMALTVIGLVTCLASMPAAAAEHQIELDTAMRVEALTSSKQLSPNQLSHILDLRRQYGLSDDETFVRTLYSAPESVGAKQSATDVLAGLAVTESEMPLMRHRAQLEWQAQDADEWASKNLGTRRYAGSAITGTDVVIYCARCGSAEREQRALAAAGFPSPL